MFLNANYIRHCILFYSRAGWPYKEAFIFVYILRLPVCFQM